MLRLAWNKSVKTNIAAVLYRIRLTPQHMNYHTQYQLAKSTIVAVRYHTPLSLASILSYTPKLFQTCTAAELFRTCFALQRMFWLLHCSKDAFKHEANGLGQNKDNDFAKHKTLLSMSFVTSYSSVTFISGVSSTSSITFMSLSYSTSQMTHKIPYVQKKLRKPAMFRWHQKCNTKQQLTKLIKLAMFRWHQKCNTKQQLTKLIKLAMFRWHQKCNTKQQLTKLIKLAMFRWHQKCNTKQQLTKLIKLAMFRWHQKCNTKQQLTKLIKLAMLRGLAFRICSARGFVNSL